MNREGFTLLEVVASISILTILSLSVGISVTTAMQADRRAADRDEARSAAGSRLEEVAAWPDFATLISTFDSQTFAVDDLAQADGTDPGRITVYQIAPETLRAEVRVTWRDESLATDLNYEISTIITNKASLGTN